MLGHSPIAPWRSPIATRWARAALIGLLAAAHVPLTAAQDGAVETPLAAINAAPQPPAEASATGDPESAAPMQLYIGVYPLEVGNLDMQAGTASVTYNVWTTFLTSRT